MSAEKSPSPLLALPTELVVAVFGSSTSIASAVNLAATCKRLNEIWKQHLTVIYNRIEAATVPCCKDLRGLLADQGLLALDAHILTIDDVTCLVETSKSVDESVKAFEEHAQRFPGFDPQVSAVLSPTEKIRFIRAQYQIWGLLRLEPTEQQERIKRMDLKQTCLLSDFLCIFDPWRIEDPVIQQLINNDPAAHRRLQQKIRGQRNKDFRKLHSDGYHPIQFTPYETGGRYAWWCDRQQEMFKKMVTGALFREDQNAATDEEKASGEVVWQSSSDEE